ncbi:MAG TPA: DUF5615 family PIN-like protein [Terracidiphilus sp.]|nr:DUF5615 family PIN-like protein [Terracidiphilus sp.]
MPFLKLLVDENLPPRLVQDLADLFPGSQHVNSVGLSGAPDAAIWEYAKAGGFAFITKDKDFGNLSVVLGAPPKVILLQTGNCSTVDLIRIIRNNAIRLAELDNDARRGLLILR